MNKYKFVFGLLFVLLFTPLVSSATGPYNEEDLDSDSSSSSCIILNYNLRYKSRDANTDGEVSSLQDFLQAQGYLNSEPTGYFGLLTLKASKAFQSANGINPTGYVSSTTRVKIKAMTCEGGLVSPVMCTMETKLCPNGSSVSRTGPSCEFAKCSTFPPGCSSTFGYSSTTGLACDGSTPISNSKPDIVVTDVECNPASPTATTDLIFCSVTVANNSYVDIKQSFDVNIQGTAVKVKAPLKAWEKRTVVNPSGFGLSIIGSNTLNFPVDIWNSVDESNENNNMFTVNMNVRSASTSFPPGCSSTFGYSSTTGLACDGSTTVTPTVHMIYPDNDTYNTFPSSVKWNVSAPISSTATFLIELTAVDVSGYSYGKTIFSTILTRAQASCTATDECSYPLGWTSPGTYILTVKNLQNNASTSRKFTVTSVAIAPDLTIGIITNKRIASWAFANTDTIDFNVDIKNIGADVTGSFTVAIKSPPDAQYPTGWSASSNVVSGIKSGEIKNVLIGSYLIHKDKSYTGSLTVVVDSQNIIVESNENNNNVQHYVTIPSVTTTPTISSLSPSSGPIGTYVTISGTGFSATGNTVRFSSFNYFNVSATNNGTNLTFNVPHQIFHNQPCVTNFSCPSVAVRETTPGDYHVQITNSKGESNYVEFKVTLGSNS